jgi:hypothetical protein
VIAILHAAGHSHGGVPGKSLTLAYVPGRRRLSQPVSDALNISHLEYAEACATANSIHLAANLTGNGGGH